MPNTRASTRLASERKHRDAVATSIDSTARNVREDDIETEAGTSVMNNLEDARRGVEKLYAQLRLLRQENGTLKSGLRRSRRIAPGDMDKNLSEKRLQSRVRSLERRIVDLQTAREKDRRIIEKLRDTEVKRDAKELAVDVGDALAAQQVTDLEDNAIKLLRRVCDTIDMNTLAEGEECAICMEEMVVEKSYSLRCRHPVCTACFKRLGNSPDVLSDDQTGSVQCPHCREVCPREECEIITHTAVQQWDLLLDLSQQWAQIDTGEMDTGVDIDNDSSIEDGSVAASESPPLPETVGQAEDHDSTVSSDGTSPVAYRSLTSPMKRKRLAELAAQRAVKQRV